MKSMASLPKPYELPYFILNDHLMIQIKSLFFSFRKTEVIGNQIKFDYDFTLNKIELDGKFMFPDIKFTAGSLYQPKMEIIY